MSDVERLIEQWVLDSDTDTKFNVDPDAITSFFEWCMKHAEELRDRYHRELPGGMMGDWERQGGWLRTLAWFVLVGGPLHIDEHGNGCSHRDCVLCGWPRGEAP